MSLELYISFIAFTLGLIAVPGPNVALIVSNSLAYGARWGLLTVSGTSAALVVQLGLAVWGLTSLMTVMSDIFEWLRWIGVAYLVFLGLRALMAPADDLSRVRPEPRMARAIWLRGFLVSLTNPKTLLFFGALFPPFVDPTRNVAGQFTLLAVTFLVLAIVGDSLWALLAARLRHVLSLRGRLRNSITGVLLLAAGLGLAVARKG